MFGKWKQQQKSSYVKLFFLHVSYCISKDPLPFFYGKKKLFFFFVRNCGHYQWCLEIYDLNFSKDVFQCYFNRVNKCR